MLKYLYKSYIILLIATVSVPGCNRDTHPSSSVQPSKAVASISSETVQIPTYLEKKANPHLEGPGPTVFAVHGLGDRPENFSALFSAYPQRARLIFPRGVISWGRGYSWFDIDIPFTHEQPDLAAGVERAADQVAALIRKMNTNERPIITGFSQGGAISFALAIRHPTLVRLAIPISGALPKGLFPKQCPGNAPPIRALHGAADDMVPIRAAQMTVNHLKKIGCDVKIESFPGISHTISSTMKTRLFHHLTQE